VGGVPLEMPEDATVDAVARRLGIPDDAARVVLVNGEDAEPDQPLSPGDVVTIFPPLMGGAPDRPMTARC
jgi:molybdopterin synthase sulfur carrier subunit